MESEDSTIEDKVMRQPQVALEDYKLVNWHVDLADLYYTFYKSCITAKITA